MKKPEIEDFYDESDPRGISTWEYDNYLKAEEEYKRIFKNLNEFNNLIKSSNEEAFKKVAKACPIRLKNK